MATPLKYGEVRDCHLDYRMKKEFIPAQRAISNFSATTVLDAGMGSGTPDYVELGTSGIGAIKLAATTDEIGIVWAPTDFDNRHRLYIRHLWTSDYATASGTATFTTLYNAVSEGSAIAIGATALTKTHGAATKTSATARTIYWTPYGYVDHTSAPAGVFNEDLAVINWTIKCTAVTGITIASDFVYWIGMELGYTPKQTFGDGSGREARLMSYNLSDMELGTTGDL